MVINLHFHMIVLKLNLFGPNNNNNTKKIGCYNKYTVNSQILVRHGMKI